MAYISTFRCVLLAFLLASITLSCAKQEAEPDEVLRPVRYQIVFATGGERMRSFSGTARAGMESRLSFKIAGTVQRLAVKVGDRVRAGQVIAELDPTDAQLQLQQAEASLAQARAQALQAQQNYERIQQLYENRNASRNDLDAARAAAESAQAQVRALQKQVELSRRQLTYTRLTAPVDGAIATVNIEVSENVQPGQMVAQLSAGTTLEVEVAIPEILIASIREGDPVTVRFDAMPNTPCAGRVTEVGVTASRMATTFPVIVKLNEEHDGARPGMAAEVAFQFVSSGNIERYYVPPVAVGEDRIGRYVFVVEAKPDEPGVGIVHRRSVTIGDLTSSGIEVLEGLADGDHVVTAGVSRIVDGQRVKLTPERGN